jgi:hypothetical protein
MDCSSEESTRAAITSISQATKFHVLTETNFFSSHRLQSILSRKTVGFFRFSTAGLNATWYSPHNTWDDPDAYPECRDLVSESSYELNQVVAHLMSRTKALDESLRQDLGGETAFHLSKIAFKDLGRIESGSGLEWQKDIFNSLLLDRLLWVKYCVENPDRAIPLPVQIPHDRFVAEEKGLEDLVDLEMNWPNTAVKFAEAWQNRNVQVTEIESPVKSLCLGMKKSSRDIHISRVSQNFCQVALAIRATFVVSLCSICLYSITKYFQEVTPDNKNLGYAQRLMYVQLSSPKIQL